MTSLGEISPSIHFSGQKLSSPIEGGYLHQCGLCHLCFRYPRLPKAAMDRLYEQTPSGNWQYRPESRQDWQIATEWLRQYSPKGRLLDIGCYDGGFLRYAGDGYERFGIEINPDAASQARSNNIQIIGSDFEDIEQWPGQFDIIVTMDVIEHVENPSALLESMTKSLRSGGIMMVSSGNTESWSWKMMGSRYWYCTIPEHIAFINPGWCRYIAHRMDLEILEIKHFSHLADASLSICLADFMKNLVYWLFPDTIAWLRKHGYGGVDAECHPSMAYTPPMWISAKDHFMVLFRKR